MATTTNRYIYYPSFNYLYGTIIESFTNYVKTTFPSFISVPDNNVIVNKKFYVNKYRVQPRTDVIAERLPSMYVMISHIINEGDTIDGLIPQVFSITGEYPLSTAVNIFDSKVALNMSMNIAMTMESVNCNIEYTVSDRSENKIQELMMFWKRYFSGGLLKTVAARIEMPLPQYLLEAVATLHEIEFDLGYVYNILNKCVNESFAISMKVNPGSKKEEIFISWDTNIVMRPSHTVLPGTDANDKSVTFARMTKAFLLTINIPSKIYLSIDTIDIEIPVIETNTEVYMGDTTIELSSMTSSSLDTSIIDDSLTTIVSTYANTTDFKEPLDADLKQLITLKDTKYGEYFDSIAEPDRYLKFIVTMTVDGVKYENYIIDWNTFTINIPKLFDDKMGPKMVGLFISIDTIEFTNWTGDINTDNAFIMKY